MSYSMFRTPAHTVLVAILSLQALHVELHAQSPYRLGATGEILLLSGGGVATVAGVVAQRSLQGFTPEEIASLSRGDVNPFDRGATWQYSQGAGTASDYLVYGLIAAPVAALVDDQVGADWHTYLVMYAEAMLLTGATVQLVKPLVGRTRPYAYNDLVPLEAKTGPDTRMSFYSSHTAFAFTSAVFLGTTYADYFPHSTWRPWVWAIALTTATAVGVLRYAAGEHFPSDILLGAAMGAGVGYAVPALHRCSTEDLSVIPAAGVRAFQVSLVYRF